MDPIPFSKPWIPEASRRHVLDALDHGRIGRTGYYTARCVAWLQGHTNREYVLLCNSGTMALQMALAARPDWTTVRVPDFTFAATANAVLAVGRRLVLCQTLPPTHSIHVPMLDCLPKTPPDGDGLIDAAQCFSNLSTLPPHADLCGSFFVNKCVTAGEGGYFATNDGTRYAWARAYQDHGRIAGGYSHALPGANGHLPDLNAALLLGQLESFGAWREDDQRQRQAMTTAWVNAGWCWVRFCEPHRQTALVLQARTAGIDARPMFPLLRTLPAFRDTPTEGAPIPVWGVLAPKWFGLPTDALRRIAEIA